MKLFTEQLAGLTAREGFALGLGGIAALAIVLYAAAWQPWQDGLTRLRTRVAEQAQTLNTLRAQAAQVELLKQRPNRGAARPGLPLLTLIERTANQSEIRESISRLSPTGRAGRVRVWMHDADFDRWLGWLETLDGRGIEVAQARIDRSAGNRVSIRATLQR